MFSRIGSMLSPLIISLEEINSALPLLILAAAAFTETILILPLPETKGIRLPETVADLEQEYSTKTTNVNSLHSTKTVEGRKECDL